MTDMCRPENFRSSCFSIRHQFFLFNINFFNRSCWYNAKPSRMKKSATIIETKSKGGIKVAYNLLTFIPFHLIEPDRVIRRKLDNKKRRCLQSNFRQVCQLL